MPRPVHLTGANSQQHRPPAPRADLKRNFRFRGKMHMMPLHFEQALLPDRIEKPRRRAVIEEFRRRLRRILEIPLCAVVSFGWQ